MNCNNMNVFLSDQDGFGEAYEITYRGNSSHGTGIGGCITLVAKAWFYSYLIMSTYVLYTDPGYAI